MCIPAALIGGLASAAGTLASSSAQSAQFKAQARFADRQAEIERERGAVAAALQQRTGARVFGSQIARFGSNGVTLNGSPRDVLSNITAENELETDRIRLNSRAREDQFRFNAGLNRSRASATRRQGIFSAATPLINSIASTVR